MKAGDCTAVVTGGASGLGEATVRSLARGSNAKVSILDLDEERGHKIAEETGDGVMFCKTDVADEKSVQDAIDKTMESYGPIHIAVNCAGILSQTRVLGKKGPVSISLSIRSCRSI